MSSNAVLGRGLMSEGGGQMSGSPRSSSYGLDQVADKGFMSYPLGIVWSRECLCKLSIIEEKEEKT